MGNPNKKRRRSFIPTFEDNFVERGREDRNLHFVKHIHGIECYFVRVTSPRCEEIFSEPEDGNLDNRANRSFLARAYVRPGSQASHVVIMYNGLDETIYQLRSSEELYEFYDELGSHLAARGMLVILLPTPYHLNRGLAFMDVRRERKKRKKFGIDYVDFSIPAEALMFRNHNIYRNHFQGFKETVALCRVLRPDLADHAWPGLSEIRDVLPSEAQEFIRKSVTERPHISLLGYSLGGLRALTEYLYDRKEAQTREHAPIFSSCVAVNSGGALSALANPPWVEPEKWRRMMRDLVARRFSEVEQAVFKGLPDDEHGEARRYFSFLDDVFLGQAASLEALGSAGRDAAAGMLFVLGGGDNLVPLESTRRFNPAGGVTIFHVAGMSHLFPYDPAWNRWKGVVFDVIALFLENTTGVRIARSSFDELANFVALLDHEFEVLFYQNDVRRQETFDEARAAVRDLDPEDAVVQVFGTKRVDQTADSAGVDRTELAAAFATYELSLLNRLQLSVERTVMHPGLYKRARRKLLLGGFITGGISVLQDCWGAPGGPGLQRNEKERIGEALVRLGFIGEEEVEDSAAEQTRVLEGIRKRMLTDFTSYMERRS